MYRFIENCDLEQVGKLKTNGCTGWQTLQSRNEVIWVPTGFICVKAVVAQSACAMCYGSRKPFLQCSSASVSSYQEVLGAIANDGNTKRWNDALAIMHEE